MLVQKLVFFIRAVTGTTKGRTRQLKSSIGILKLTKNQAKKLEVKPNTQLSPHLEKCCLLLSANVSYANTARDLESLTGLRISHSTQQKLVQRYEFTKVRVKQEVEELTVDGGKVRIRTPKGLGCEWRDYKAVNLDGQAVAAHFQDNKALLHWVNQQQLSEIVTCIGDGHDGIWNLIAGIANNESRLEILDWYSNPRWVVERQHTQITWEN